ncbi:hypothetical protein KTE51_28975, partial [Burkholderia multivorans]|nr:hypothetical protein [Burkholderia multivorans]
CPKFVINDWLTHLLGPSVTMAKVNRMLKKLTALGLFLKPSLSSGTRAATVSPIAGSDGMTRCEPVRWVPDHSIKRDSAAETVEGDIDEPVN